MAIAVQTSSSSNVAAATSTTINKPTSTVEGDYLFAVIGFEGGGGSITVNSVPSGWTLKEPTTGNPDMYTYYKVAGSSEPSTYAWGISSSTNIGGSILRIDGQNQISGSEIGASSENTVSNDDTPSFPTGITPTAANSLIMIASASKQNGSTAHSSPAITTSDPAGWTIVQGTPSGGFTVSIAYDVRPETTSTGAWSLTAGNNSNATDTVSQIHSVVPRIDGTATPGVLNLTTTINAPTVVAGANVTPSAVNITATINAPTVTGDTAKWITEDKSDTSPTITNQTKN